MTLQQAFTNVLMNMNDKETVVAFINTLQEADDELAFLDALRAAGVDNWEGFSDAQEILNERDEWKD